jgi:hypothetical protein
MIALSAIPWRLIGIVAGVLALLVICKVVAGKFEDAAKYKETKAEYAGYRELVQANAVRAVERYQRDAAADDTAAKRIEALEAERARLAAAVGRINPTVERPDENGVTRVSVNPDWWVCVSNHVRRNPADTAACEALAIAGRVPDAIRR